MERLPKPNEHRIQRAAQTIAHIISGPHPLASHGDHFTRDNPDMIPFEDAVDPQFDYYEGDIAFVTEVLGE